jgi:hypothetical protein
MQVSKQFMASAGFWSMDEGFFLGAYMHDLGCMTITHCTTSTHATVAYAEVTVPAQAI